MINDMTAEATQLNHLAGHQDQKLLAMIAEGKLHKFVSTLPTGIYLPEISKLYTKFKIDMLVRGIGKFTNLDSD